MASYQVSPPEPFTFSKPEEWPKWIRRFERFRVASGLDTKSDEMQINTLIYSMGDEADDILSSFRLSEEHSKTFEVVKARFESFFVKKRNVIYERARFNLRRQEDGESVASFINDLYALAEHCGYGELHDEMIRDRLVVGILDKKLSERLQLDADLTLEKAVTSVRQSEMVHQQQSLLHGGEPKHVPIDAVQTIRKPIKKNPSSSQERNQFKRTTFSRCSRCGKSPNHDLEVCPAKGMTCRKCGKKGHFQRTCKSAKISIVSESQNEESVFLGVVSGSKDLWTIPLQLNGREVNFCIDTGAEVTVIPETVYTRIGSPLLRPLDKTLKGPSNGRLESRGRFVGYLQKDKVTTEQQIYVVKNLHKPLLGRPAIRDLNLVNRIDNVTEQSQSVLDQFPSVFNNLGKIRGDYTITLQDGAKPFALTTPRRVPIPLLKPVREELKRMENMGVISPIKEPTDWCAGMVPVKKKNGQVRICVDLTRLNQSVKRELHPLPAVEQVLAQLTGAKVFSKLDANSGFWQIPLDPKSAKLTTFITPFGRYYFNRLPFGITSAPEHFHRRISEILSGTDGTVSMLDDVLVFGKNQKEHDEHLTEALKRIEKAGLTLNKEKCRFSKERITFLGQIIDSSGILPDPNKVSAIKNVGIPKNISDVRRFLGMTNQLNKFIPNLADETKVLRDLLCKKNSWMWERPQQEAFDKIKRLLSSPPVLALYDPNANTIVSADASSYGLGAVLLQEQENGDIKPISYVSRSMSPTEERYAQIEKEALAFTWACERFSDFLIGLKFTIQTDHKPLIPLFSTKRLEELPIRVQRFRMRMMRFDFSIAYIPGKKLVIADALSRAPLWKPDEHDELFQEETKAYVDSVVQGLPATEQRLEEIKINQERDPICQEITRYCQEGWPEKGRIQGPVKRYYPVSSEISIINDLLMRNGRIIIPLVLQKQVLSQLHTGHQGIQKCRDRAKQAVWWPGLSKELEDLVNKCPICCRHQVKPTEPMISSPLPELPWQKVGMDLFEWKKATYLIIVDYYSRFIEVARLTRMTAEEVIRHCKSVFARHGIPERVITDNGPQFDSSAFRKFSKDYQFDHATSSPYYPRGNGEAERAVKTIKGLLKKEGDPYLALLAYRSTPLCNGYSPSELLMSRKLRTNVPSSRQARKPAVPDKELLITREKEIKRKQKSNFDRRHRARDVSPALQGDLVWIPDRNESGTVRDQVGPRSHRVETPTGEFRRNRRDIIPIPREEVLSGGSESQDTEEDTVVNKALSPRRSKRITYKPFRYDPCAE